MPGLSLLAVASLGARGARGTWAPASDTAVPKGSRRRTESCSRTFITWDTSAGHLVSFSLCVDAPHPVSHIGDSRDEGGDILSFIWLYVEKLNVLYV